MTATIQARPSPTLYLPDELGTELVPAASQYDAGGEFTLAVFQDRRYVWIGTEGETCSNDGNAEASNEPFDALASQLLLTGDPETPVLASVKEVLR